MEKGTSALFDSNKRTTPLAKRATLLHTGRLALQDIYYNIPGANIDEAVDGDDVFTVAVKKFDSYFSPKQCNLYKRLIFGISWATECLKKTKSEYFYPVTV